MENLSTNLNKKREKDNKTTYVEEDYNIYYDSKNTHIMKDEDKKDLDEIIDVDFLFSEIRDSYFFGIKNFVEKLLDFDEFDASGFSDLVLLEKDFIGTVIKTELEEESGNELPDLYSFATLVPLDMFGKLKSISQIMNYCIKNTSNDFKEILTKTYDSVMKDSKPQIKLGILINERVSNLPLQLTGPLLNLIREDIVNFQDANDNDDKYSFTHILYITK